MKNRLVPAALLSMTMMLSGPVALAHGGGTSVATAHVAAHAAAPHEAHGGGAASHSFFRVVGDLGDFMQAVEAPDDEDEGDAEPPEAPADPEAYREAVRVAELYYGYTAPPPPPVSQITVPVTAPAPTHRQLDPAQALSVLHAVDLSTCSDQGPGGYGHARVTFGADGQPAGVQLDAPQGLSKEAVACIQSQFAGTSVPAFDGNAVTAGASFYVK